MYTQNRHKCFDLPEFNIWAGQVCAREYRLWCSPRSEGRFWTNARLVIPRWSTVSDVTQRVHEWDRFVAFQTLEPLLPVYWNWSRWCKTMPCYRAWLELQVTPQPSTEWDKVEMESICLVHWFCEPDIQVCEDEHICNTQPGAYTLTCYRPRNAERCPPAGSYPAVYGTTTAEDSPSCDE